jgi:hypothetical protein
VLPPHHRKVLKPTQRHITPAEVARAYGAHSHLTAQPNTVDAVDEARQRGVEVLEQGFGAAAADFCLADLVAPKSVLGGEHKFAFPSTIAGHFRIERLLHNAIRDI